MIKIFIVLLSILVLFSSCSFDNEENIVLTNENKENKIIATWVTYSEIIDLIKSVENEDDLKEVVESKIIILKDYSINTIFLHVRAFDDCFYESSIFPINTFCLNQNGEIQFDVLKVFIDVCKIHDIEIHAWLNPYRIRNDSNLKAIKGKTLASNFINCQENEGLIVTEDSIYYNPANIDVQEYILSGVKELIENYDINGIHIDDYFYPTQSEDIDKLIYTKYLENGGVLSLADFRRQQINSLVSSIFTLVKNFDYNLIFSISPSGDITKNYNESYADVLLWLKEDGYADYIIPQLYYGYNHEAKSFQNVLKEWLNCCDSSKLIIGLGLYKSGKLDEFALSGQNEWIYNHNIISCQINDLINYSCSGYAVFSASYMYNEYDNIALYNECNNMKKTLEKL